MRTSAARAGWELRELLVDYHIHLQPDSHIGRCRYSLDNLDSYLGQARAAGISEIGITEHSNRFREFLPVFERVMDQPDSIPAIDRWIREGCTETVADYAQFLSDAKQSGRPIKASMEVDYIPGEEDSIRTALDGYAFDYVLGSVHFVGNWAVDVSADAGWPDRCVDDVFRQYFETVVQAIESRLFDCIAHPDLVKKLGFAPNLDLTPYYEAVARAMKETDTAYEVSTAGLFRPVGEVYPSLAFMRVLHDYGVPLVLSSDAHRPEEVGRAFDHSVQIVRSVGYTEVAVFDGRKRHSAAL